MEIVKRSSNDHFSENDHLFELTEIFHLSAKFMSHQRVETFNLKVFSPKFSSQNWNS